jgi:hypothetical protein
MISMTLAIALNSGTLSACLTIPSQLSSQAALKHTPWHALKDAPNWTRWHTPSLLDFTFPIALDGTLLACLIMYSQLHSMTLPACLTVRSQVSSHVTPKYISESLSSTLPIPLDGTLPAYLALRSQVHSQEGRHSYSRLTTCSHVCFYMLDPETC